MKPGIHPKYELHKVACACGNSFETYTTVGELHIEICNECHPYLLENRNCWIRLVVSISSVKNMEQLKKLNRSVPKLI